jgi:fused signal recognition particle receptor
MIGYPKSLLLTEFLTEFDMFSFKKRKSQPSDESTNKDSEVIDTQNIPAQVDDAPEKPVPEKKGLFGRLKSGLAKTRASLTDGLANLVLGKKTIDDDLLEELETQLLTADVGITVTQKIISDLTDRISRKQLDDADALLAALREDMANILAPCSQPLTINEKHRPFVILVVGVNGVGKTTTIGKLARRFQDQGNSVMLAAGDTFRAAAVEQLQAWGERNDVQVIAQHSGADSASVIYDAVEAAKARNIDVLIADTAGRLHTQSNLMEELKKIKRVITKLDADAPHEVLLVVDAGTGQNALSQAQQFNEAVQLTGITLTKLDGTAKGGIIFAIAENLGLPIRFIGVGEGIEDLRVFNAEEFTQALFEKGNE